MSYKQIYEDFKATCNGAVLTWKGCDHQLVRQKIANTLWGLCKQDLGVSPEIIFIIILFLDKAGAERVGFNEEQMHCLGREIFS